MWSRKKLIFPIKIFQIYIWECGFMGIVYVLFALKVRIPLESFWSLQNFLWSLFQAELFKYRDFFGFANFLSLPLLRLRLLASASVRCLIGFQYLNCLHKLFCLEIGLSWLWFILVLWIELLRFKFFESDWLIHFSCCLDNLNVYASSFSSCLRPDGGDSRFWVVFLWDLASS